MLSITLRMAEWLFGSGVTCTLRVPYEPRTCTSLFNSFGYLSCDREAQVWGNKTHVFPRHLPHPSHSSDGNSVKVDLRGIDIWLL